MLLEEGRHLQDDNVWQGRGIIGKCRVHVVRKDADVHQRLCAIEGEHQQIQGRRCHGRGFRRAVGGAQVVVAADAGAGACRGRRMPNVEQSRRRH